MRGQPQKLVQRRTRMLTLKAQGVPLKTIVHDLADEYECTPQALYIDWKKRDSWAREIARLDDPALLDELIQGLKQIIPNAWYEYKTNPNPSVKLGALKLAQQTYITLIEILQSMGIVEKMPEQVQVEIDLSVFTDAEKSILDKATRILQEKSKGKSPKIH